MEFVGKIEDTQYKVGFAEQVKLKNIDGGDEEVSSILINSKGFE